MNKKAVFNLQTYFVGILVVMGVIVTFGTAFISSAEKYNINTQNATAFTNTYNQMSEFSQITETADTKTTSADLGDQSGSVTFLGNMLTVGKTIYSSLAVPAALVQDMGSRFPIPPIWINIITAVLTILAITTLLFLIFRNNGNR